MGQELAVHKPSGVALSADPEDGEEIDWGAKVHKDLLNFASGSSADDTFLAEESTAEARVVFQRKLAVISDSPANYLRPFTFAGSRKVRVDLEKKKDRFAAITACVRLRGVSRWKPNLVPRLVSEEEFFSNLFSYILATADEHFRAAPDLKYIPHEAPAAENAAEEKLEALTDMALRQTNGDAGTELHTKSVKMMEEPAGDTEVLLESGTVKDKEKESMVEPVASTQPPKSAFAQKTPTDPEPKIESKSSGEHAVGRTNGNGTGSMESSKEKTAESLPASSESSVVATTDNWKAQARFGTIYPSGAKTTQLKASFSEKNVLFFIEKSQNSNCVVYVANVDEDGKLDRQNPIHPYWILYERSPVVEEELTMAERLTAYGTTVSPIVNKPGHYMLAISSVKSRPFEVWIDSSGFLHSIGQCNGKLDEILSIYVHVNFNWIGIPSVEYVDILGRQGKERVYSPG